MKRARRITEHVEEGGWLYISGYVTFRGEVEFVEAFWNSKKLAES